MERNSYSNVRPTPKYHEYFVVTTLPWWPLNEAGFAVWGVWGKSCSGERFREKQPPSVRSFTTASREIVLQAPISVWAALQHPCSLLPVCGGCCLGRLSSGGRKSTELIHHSPGHLAAALTQIQWHKFCSLKQTSDVFALQTAVCY